jgi:hypothetical protein
MRLPSPSQPLIHPVLGRSSAERSPLAASPEAGTLSPRTAVLIGVCFVLSLFGGAVAGYVEHGAGGGSAGREVAR